VATPVGLASEATLHELGVFATGFLGSAAYGPEPPAKSDEEETPIFKELGWFAFGGVAEELADPAQGKQG